MATFTTTAKHALRRLTGTSFVNEIDEGIAALADDVDAKMAAWSSGPIGNRPTSTTGSPGKAGRIYYADDTGETFLDYGTGWIHLGAQPGDIKATGRATAPEGWLICDGTTVSRTAYAFLWNALRNGGASSPYGDGNGTTTFTLPDLRGRVPVGEDATGLRIATAAGRDRGESGGAEKHTLVEAEIPAHFHSMATRSWTDQSLGGSSGLEAFGGTGGSATTEGTNLTGGGGAHNNMQPYQVVNWLIRT